MVSTTAIELNSVNTRTGLVLDIPNPVLGAFTVGVVVIAAGVCGVTGGVTTGGVTATTLIYALLWLFALTASLYGVV
jgi:hypothetical protein